MMKKMRVLLVVGLLLLSFAAMATVSFAANNYEQMNVTADKVAYGKLDVGKLTLNDSRNRKIIEIDNGALVAAANKGQNFKIIMNDVVLSFAPTVFNTDKYKNSVASGRTVKVVLEVLLNENYDTGKYLATSSGLRGDDFFSRTGFEISAEVYESGAFAYKLSELAAPMTVSYNYDSAWKSSITTRSQSGIKLAWYDRDRIVHSYGGWDVLDSTLDTNNKLVSAKTSYLSGLYLPVVTTGNGGNQNHNGGTTAAGGGAMPAYAKESITALQELGIVPTDMQSYNIPITRQEFAALLVRTVNAGAEPDFANPFRDVNSSNQYYSEIMAGASSGLISGKTATAFAPNDRITRQEIACLFTRALSFKGVEPDSSSSGLNQLTDVGKIGAWAKSGCAAAYNAQLIGGRAQNGKTAFEPQAETTRAEAMVMLCRLLNLN